MSTAATKNTLLLGVDIGTGSSKGVLARADGEVVAVSERPHDLSLPAPGWAEHDAEAVWWRDFVEICAELLPQVGDGELAGLAVSGIGPCIVACDEDARPLRPAILYGIDTRSGAEVDELTRLLGEENGERCPILDPLARGTICGLTLSHGRGHLYRALLEGTAYAARHILDAMAAAGTTPTRLFSVGGGTTGGLWPQIVSDVTGLAQDITQQSMGACYGDAMLAGVASGIVERDAEWTSVARRVEPNPEAKRVYDELYAVYRELHPRTADLQHRLAALQTSQ